MPNHDDPSQSVTGNVSENGRHSLDEDAENVHARDDVQALVVNLVIDKVVRHVRPASSCVVDPPADERDRQWLTLPRPADALLLKEDKARNEEQTKKKVVITR